MLTLKYALTNVPSWADVPTVNKIYKKMKFTSGKWAKILPAKHYGNSKFASTDATVSI
jgi:hypothetical protein